MSTALRTIVAAIAFVAAVASVIAWRAAVARENAAISELAAAKVRWLAQDSVYRRQADSLRVRADSFETTRLATADTARTAIRTVTRILTQLRVDTLRQTDTVKVTGGELQAFQNESRTCSVALTACDSAQASLKAQLSAEQGNATRLAGERDSALVIANRIAHPSRLKRFLQDARIAVVAGAAGVLVGGALHH